MLNDFLNTPVDNPVALPALIAVIMTIVVLLDWWGRRKDRRSPAQGPKPKA